MCLYTWVLVPTLAVDPLSWSCRQLWAFWCLSGTRNWTLLLYMCSVCMHGSPTLSRWFEGEAKTEARGWPVKGTSSHRHTYYGSPFVSNLCSAFAWLTLNWERREQKTTSQSSKKSPSTALPLRWLPITYTCSAIRATPSLHTSLCTRLESIFLELTLILGEKVADGF